MFDCLNKYKSQISKTMLYHIETIKTVEWAYVVFVILINRNVKYKKICYNHHGSYLKHD